MCPKLTAYHRHRELYKFPVQRKFKYSNSYVAIACDSSCSTDLLQIDRQIDQGLQSHWLVLDIRNLLIGK